MVIILCTEQQFYVQNSNFMHKTSTHISERARKRAVAASPSIGMDVHDDTTRVVEGPTYDDEEEEEEKRMRQVICKMQAK